MRPVMMHDGDMIIRPDAQGLRSFRTVATGARRGLRGSCGGLFGARMTSAAGLPELASSNSPGSRVHLRISRRSEQ